MNITSNSFEYTTVDEQAELLLKVTDPDGTEVTALGSLERKTSGGVTGFDITESTGLITIADNYEITSTGTVTQYWTVEIIFANLDTDQQANTGKSFSASLIIQEEEMTSVSLGNLAEYITQTVYTGVDGENGLYYHDGNISTNICFCNDNVVYYENELITDDSICQRLYFDYSGDFEFDVAPVTWQNDTCIIS